MTLFKSFVASALVAVIGSSAFAKECSILASSSYKDSVREAIRSELGAQGVTVLFAEEQGVNDFESPYEETPEQINIGDNFNYIILMRDMNLPKIYLGELYTSNAYGLYNQTVITEFAFGVAKIQDCRYRASGEGGCKAVLAEKGMVFERVTAHSTRDLIVAGGDLKDLKREKASDEEIRAYLRDLAPRLCK